MPTPDLSPAARAVSIVLATLQAAQIDATPAEIADLAGITIAELADATADLAAARMIVGPEPVERLSLPARVVLVAVCTASIPRDQLIAALVAVGLNHADADTTITNMVNAGLIADYNTGTIDIDDLGMALLEQDVRAGVVDTDPIRLRVDVARLRSLCATADHHGQTLAEAIVDHMT